MSHESDAPTAIENAAIEGNSHFRFVKSVAKSRSDISSEMFGEVDISDTRSVVTLGCELSGISLVPYWRRVVIIT